MRSNAPYEEGFLIILLLTAIVGLLWLFSPFLEALLFAMILATATYSLYLKVLPKVKQSPNYASAVMSVFASNQPLSGHFVNKKRNGEEYDMERSKYTRMISSKVDH